MVMTLQNPDTQAHNYDDHDQEISYLVTTASELDLPDGLFAEVFGRNIVVSPWSRTSYLKGMGSLLRQLGSHAPDGYTAREAPVLFEFPGQGACGPDIWVADADVLDLDLPRAPGEMLALVGELTSPATRSKDLNEKVDVYGKAEVPVYLLFDMKEQMLTVYSDPSVNRGYQAQKSVEFGQSVSIPEPFDFELDTTAFKRKQV